MLSKQRAMLNDWQYKCVHSQLGPYLQGCRWGVRTVVRTIEKVFDRLANPNPQPIPIL